MILFFDIKYFQKLLDYNQTITCKECGHFGRYEVYLVGNRFRLFFIPIITFGKRYIVKTTCCDTFYQLKPEVGKAIEKGRPTTITEDDLTLYQVGSNPETSRCPNCGQIHEVGANFCPNCGQNLK
ncbi:MULTISPECIES: zinc-ribbon domain-containing protein [unclassified Jeotgalibaca]|uniref:zinc-ribbon domain-containing protein n=1 Tax=unclassified Jeotgalibaca TaxID=2621505 RepID=UPI003FD39339